MNDQSEWVMVPREPTQEMIKAAEQQWLVGGTNDMARREWHAMLAAAPPAPTVSAEPVLWVYQFGDKIVSTNNADIAKRMAKVLGVAARPLIYGDTAPPPVEASQQQASGEVARIDGNETNPIVLWTEIERLRAAVKGPQGYESWKSAATDERIRRVKAEAEISRLTAELAAARAEAEALRKDAERFLCPCGRFPSRAIAAQQGEKP